MRPRQLTAFVATLLVAAGCGGTVQGTGVTDGAGSGGKSPGGAGNGGESQGGAGNGGESQGGAGGASPGTGGRTNTGTARNPQCGTGIPADGTRCAFTAAECEYATPNAPSYCTTRARCEQSSRDGPLMWIVTPPPTDCLVSRPECPLDVAPADGSECAVSPSVDCYYASGRCDCVPPSSCSPKPTATWLCVPYARNCPSPHPLWGDACPSGVADCGGYCGSSVGGELSCKDGYWASGGEAPCIACVPP